jgi:hypothetical protein
MIDWQASCEGETSTSDTKGAGDRMVELDDEARLDDWTGRAGSFPFSYSSGFIMAGRDRGRRY